MIYRGPTELVQQSAFRESSTHRRKGAASNIIDMDWLYLSPSQSYDLYRGSQSTKIFLQTSELGLPHPLTRRRVCPPPLRLGGGGLSLAGEGVGKSQFRRGDVHCGPQIYNICTLCRGLFRGSLHRHKGAARHVIDIVWLYP